MHQLCQPLKYHAGFWLPCHRVRREAKQGAGGQRHRGVLGYGRGAAVIGHPDAALPADVEDLPHHRQRWVSEARTRGRPHPKHARQHSLWLPGHPDGKASLAQMGVHECMPLWTY